ncbi:MAG: hypothetical protein ACD_63C00232G0004 [uncultured bacterium]|nr:MAG: hypothetical protein ACD_63C00232G0004 [uncultured bacterium]
MKVALVHEHLAQDGGAENVLRVLYEIYSDAPIFTLVYDRKKANPAFRNADIRTSFIQKLPFGLRFYQAALPFMPTAVEKYNLSEFDVVLSSASAYAKGVITIPQTLHICYCHSPTRYLWNDTHTYYKELRYNRLIKSIIPFALTKLRQWDRVAADRVDKFIANSRYVQKRIKKYYKADSDIIYPPVETDKFEISEEIDDYYFMIGRLVAYKRFDLAIKAFNKVGRPLKIAGEGPELEYLKSIAGPNIELLGKVSDAKRRELISKCQAFIFPPEEDFGITPVEAMASGRPVIAYGRGGALESVVPGKTGILFEEQTPDALIDALNKFKLDDFDPREIRQHALQYDKERFKKDIKDYVDKAWNEFRS